MLMLLLGLYDQATEGRWRWVDCSNADDTYTNWGPGQPNDLANSTQPQDCGQIVSNANAEWNDWSCERALQYICEITEKG